MQIEFVLKILLFLLQIKEVMKVHSKRLIHISLAQLLLKEQHVRPTRKGPNWTVNSVATKRKGYVTILGRCPRDTAQLRRHARLRSVKPHTLNTQTQRLPGPPLVNTTRHH